MTDEPVYTASKERMAPGVNRFLSEHAPQLSITVLTKSEVAIALLCSAEEQ